MTQLSLSGTQILEGFRPELMYCTNVATVHYTILQKLKISSIFQQSCLLMISCEVLRALSLARGPPTQHTAVRR